MEKNKNIAPLPVAGKFVIGGGGMFLHFNPGSSEWLTPSIYKQCMLYEADHGFCNGKTPCNQ